MHLNLNTETEEHYVHHLGHLEEVMELAQRADVTQAFKDAVAHLANALNMAEIHTDHTDPDVDDGYPVTSISLPPVFSKEHLDTMSDILEGYGIALR